VAIDPSGAVLASAGEDGRVFFTEAAGAAQFKPLGYLDLGSAVTALSWCELDGEKRLLASTQDRRLLSLQAPAVDSSPPADLLLSPTDVDARGWGLPAPLCAMATSPAVAGSVFGFKLSDAPSAKGLCKFDLLTVSASTEVSERSHHRHHHHRLRPRTGAFAVAALLLRVGDNGIAKIWKRRGISVGSYYDGQSHHLHPHPSDRLSGAAGLCACRCRASRCRR
jgi:WD40 repeat protein